MRCLFVGVKVCRVNANILLILGNAVSLCLSVCVLSKLHGTVYCPRLSYGMVSPVTKSLRNLYVDLNVMCCN
jgi:hypothetical protein